MKIPNSVARAALGLALCSSAWSMDTREGDTAVTGFGVPVASAELEDYRGGFDLVKNDMQLNGSVADNSAIDVVTGSNYIADGSFSNSSGLPVVIQNSGSNVLIQNATIVNVQFQ